MRRRAQIKRLAVAVLSFAVPVLFVASFVSSFFRSSRTTFAGAWPLVFAGAIAALNFHLSFVRPRLYYRRVRSMDGYRNVSAFPMIGWLGLIAALVVAWGARGTALLGILICFLDTGGPVWFLVWTWRDQSLWESR